MGKAVVDVIIPVSPEAASRLQDEHVRRKAGAILSALVATGDDPLFSVLDDIGRRVQEAGLTDEEIEVELAAYNAERRV